MFLSPRPYELSFPYACQKRYFQNYKTQLCSISVLPGTWDKEKVCAFFDPEMHRYPDQIGMGSLDYY
jgi:hypothetical protein